MEGTIAREEWKQFKRSAYLLCNMLFKLPEEGIDFQVDMPEVTHYSKLASLPEIAAPWIDKLKPPMRAIFSADAAFEFKPVDAVDPSSA